MTKTVKRGYIHFPIEWEHVESQQVGPFVTRIVHRRQDGSSDVRTTRRHRKQFGPEVAEKERPKLLLWRPRSLNWWISVLFMIGSLHFIFGSLLVLAGATYTYLIDLIFLVLWDLMGLTVHMGVRQGNACTHLGQAIGGEIECQHA